MDRLSIDEKVFSTKLNNLNITFNDVVLNRLQRLNTKNCCDASVYRFKNSITSDKAFTIWYYYLAIYYYQSVRAQSKICVVKFGVSNALENDINFKKVTKYFLVLLITYFRFSISVRPIYMSTYLCTYLSKCVLIYMIHTVHTFQSGCKCCGCFTFFPFCIFLKCIFCCAVAQQKKTNPITRPPSS